jgi:hypothetical protein
MIFSTAWGWSDQMINVEGVQQKGEINGVALLGELDQPSDVDIDGLLLLLARIARRVIQTDNNDEHKEGAA